MRANTKINRFRLAIKRYLQYLGIIHAEWWDRYWEEPGFWAE